MKVLLIVGAFLVFASSVSAVTGSDVRGSKLQIRDEKKRVLVERLNLKVCELRNNRVLAMGKQVERLSELSRKAKARGAVTVSAEAKIAEAKAAVDALAARTCPSVTVATDATAGAQVRSVVLQLKTELLNAHRKILDAKKALTEAIKYEIKN